MRAFFISPLFCIAEKPYCPGVRFRAFKGAVVDLIQAAEVAVVPEIGKLYLCGERIRLDPADIVHIRHTVRMSHQRDRLHHLGRKAVGAQLVEGHVGILDNVVQQSDADGVFVVHLLGKVERMIDIRHSALVGLVLMRRKGDFERRLCKLCIEHFKYLFSAILLSDKASLYAFRHSWATIAQNECGATMNEVDFGLNHSTNKMAKVYVQVDYTPAWILNEKVIDFIFFTDKESKFVEKEDKTFDRISKYNNIRAEAFVMGKKVCALEDTGFTNVDQIMDKLTTLLPKKIKNARVQFKITNVDKNLTQMYQRLVR